jgi:hypothetical protein
MKMLRLRYQEEIENICSQGGKISAKSIVPLLFGQDIDILDIYFPKNRVLFNIPDPSIEYSITDSIENKEELYYTIVDGSLTIDGDKTDKEIFAIQMKILNLYSKSEMDLILGQNSEKDSFEQGIDLIKEGLTYFEMIKRRRENLNKIDEGIKKLQEYCIKK